MMKRLLAVTALIVLPSLASAQGIGEILEGLTSPQLIAGVSYNSDSPQEWNAVLTANILGPKLGTLPCYISGVGVGLNTIAPGLEDTTIAAWSFPLLSCAPWGERVTIQTGMSTPLSDLGGQKSWYIGIGIGVAESPNSLKTKRVKRIEAKKAANQGPPAPGS
jgi:hypothetical protein